MTGVQTCALPISTLPFLDHSPGSSGFEDLEDLGSETDKRGSEDQPSEAKSAPVVFFCEAGESTSLVCPEFELSFCWSNRCRRILTHDIITQELRFQAEDRYADKLSFNAEMSHFGPFCQN